MRIRFRSNGPARTEDDKRAQHVQRRVHKRRGERDGGRVEHGHGFGADEEDIDDSVDYNASALFRGIHRSLRSQDKSE